MRFRARCILAAVAIGAFGCAPALALTWEVEAGSRGNVLELEFYNLDQATQLDAVAVAATETPEWMRMLRIESSAEAALAPGELTVAKIYFDVRADVAAGTTGELRVELGSGNGGAWRQPIPFKVVEAAETIQSDCCASLDIITTGVPADETAMQPAATGLSIESRPNPSPPDVTVLLGIVVAGEVLVTVHDVTGRLVRELAIGSHAAGAHRLRWDGRDARGAEVESGLYFIRAQAGDEVRTAKIVVTR